MVDAPKYNSRRAPTVVSASGCAASTVEPRATHYALSHGGLVGDAHVRRGFSFDDHWDRLFGLGYPHLALLTSDTIDDAQLDHVAVSVFNKNPYGIEWPTMLARPIARLLPRAREVFQPGTHNPSELAKRTLRDTSDLGEDEAHDLIRLLFTGSWTFDRYIRTSLFLLEALLGERATIALVEVLTSLPTQRFREHNVELSMTIARLGLMLLRTSPPVHAHLAARLEAFSAGLGPSESRSAGDDRVLPLFALDFVLHGHAGALRAFPEGIGLGMLSYLDVPRPVALGCIRAAAREGPLATPPDVRRVFLAGPEALDVESGWIRDYTQVVASAPQIMLETYGLVNDPRTVSLVLELSRKRPLATAARRWFEAHRDLAGPALERIAATDRGRAAAAADALAALG